MNLEYLVANLLLTDDKVKAVFEQAVYSHANLQESLCSNPTLSQKGWLKLYKRKKVSLDEAFALVSRRLDSTQREFVILNEKRLRVLLKMAEFNHLSEFEVEKLSSKKYVTAKFATDLIDHLEGKAPHVSRELALRAAGVTQLRWLALDPTVTEEDAREALKVYPSWKPEKSYSQQSLYLGAVLERFPSLISLYLEPGADSALFGAGAASSFVTDALALNWLAFSSGFDSFKYPLLSLVNNPVLSRSTVESFAEAFKDVGALETVVSSAGNRLAKPYDHVDSFETVSDPEYLKWLFKRSMPNEYYESRGHLKDCVGLIFNPNLDASSREAYVDRLSYYSSLELFGAAAKPLWDKIVERFPQYQNVYPSDFPSFQRPLEISEDRWEEIEGYTVDQAAKSDVLNLKLLDVFYWGSSSSIYSTTVTSKYLQDNLNLSVEAWETLLGLVTSFDGSVRELVETVNQLT